MSYLIEKPAQTEKSGGFLGMLGFGGGKSDKNSSSNNVDKGGKFRKIFNFAIFLIIF